MTVLSFQLLIVATLILTRILAAKWLLGASLIWTGLTLVNLFWPPLIIMQLIVIWGTYGLLTKTQQIPDTDVSKFDSPADGKPTGKAIAPSSSTKPPNHLPSMKPVVPRPVDETAGSASWRGAGKFTTALGELNTYIETQSEIQRGTAAMLIGYNTERYLIEKSLEAAERKLKLKRKLDADPEFKRLFEENYQKLETATAETRESSKISRIDEHKCVDFRPTKRHNKPEIAEGIEKKYHDTINEYSNIIENTTKRLKQKEGLRDIFEEQMVSLGGLQILKRIKHFEAGWEWRYDINLVEARFVPNQRASSVSPPFESSVAQDQTCQPESIFDTIAPSANNFVKSTSRGADMFDSYMAKHRAKLRTDQRVDMSKSYDEIMESAADPIATRQSGILGLPLQNADATPLLAPLAYARKRRSLSQDEREEIKRIAVGFRIPSLFHFTRMGNLESIFKHGLCSISKTDELGIEPHVNDNIRLDGYLDAVSLSIAFPNHLMFYSYRKREPSMEWAVLAVDPSILWRKNCAFCERNAADHRIRDRPLVDLMNAHAFRSMFEIVGGVASREEQRLRDYDPTDPQAEVLVFDTIEPSQIVGIAFDSHQVRNACTHFLGWRHTRVVQENTGVFGARSFARKAIH